MLVNLLIPDPGELLASNNPGCAAGTSCFVILLLLPIVLIGLAIVAALAFGVFEALKFW